MLTRSAARIGHLAKAGFTAARHLPGGVGAAAEPFAAALGDLRGLATKVGQMASYIEGMVPEDARAAAAFAKLRNNVTQSDPSAIQAVVEVDLGAPLPTLFPDWEEAPFACASLGQVHRASLPDGTLVAVKVQHPGIEEAVGNDLNQAERLGKVIASLASGIPVEDLIREVRARLQDELHYEAEATSQALYGRAFEDDLLIKVPEVVATHTSRRVFTSHLASGLSLEEVQGEPPSLRSLRAEALWRAFVEGALRTKLLHGDPHPGNFLFPAEGRLILLDFGCMQPLQGDVFCIFKQILKAGCQSQRELGHVLHTHLGKGPLAEAIISLWSELLAPLSSEHFRVDRAHAQRVAAVVRAAKHPSVTFSKSEPLPPWLLVAHRTFVGLISVLARLDTPSHYREPTLAALAKAEEG